MARMVKRLSNLEIDEVSLVDRPANQHGVVAIAKRDQEVNMPVFDAEGNEVFEDELQPGDYVYDEQGQEYQYVDASASDGEDQGDEEYEDEEEDVEVGKARVPVGPLRRHDYVGRAGRAVRNRASDEKLATQMFVGRHGAAARRRAEPALERVRGVRSRAGEGAARAGQRARNTATAAGMQYRAIPAGGRAGLRYGGAAGAGGYTVYETDRRRGVRKSFGDQILTELSKALTEDDRDQVIAKAMDRIDEVAKRNDELEQTLAMIVEDRELEGYGEVAKSYGLGSEEDIAGLLFRASQVLPEEDVALLDSFFSSAGEVQKAYFDELGVIGGDQGSILDGVYAMATDAVVKNAELGMSEEQAFVAALAANPAAYDEYEAEQRYQR